MSRTCAIPTTKVTNLIRYIGLRPDFYRAAGLFPECGLRLFGLWPKSESFKIVFLAGSSLRKCTSSAEKIDSYFEASRTSDSAFPASSSFYHLLTPKGGTKSVRQAKSSGNGRRMHLKRYSASSRPRFRRRIRRPFFFPFFRNAESVVRCAQLRLFVCVRTWQIYGLPECSAKIADEVTSSARAPGAGVQNSGVFCARSASAGVVTRYFSPCLIFRCFWIKPKAQGKEF